ncbi:D-isomer specific 2-hydroxyacid dehydrogenase family protein [Sphaerisporangium flaviroseum]|uniref:D-isomer specific 2-hydroxyacid dehydrogenase family protein n=1 Tax=Sphaerisporangium flaviroseum TaxID=509199 RepID=A0ABP7IBI4_9ACTN
MAGKAGTILVTGAGIDPSLLEPLLDLGFDLRRPRQPLSENRLVHELKGAVAYLHGGEERATARALESAAHTLKVVAFLGVGYENFIDVARADELGIVVTNTPGAATDSVAEFTVGQIFLANRRIFEHLGNRLPDWTSPEELPHNLRRRKIGIVGMGSIGTRIAEMLTMAFGAEVAYYSRTPKKDVEERLGITFLPLHELAENSDILVVMVPLTEKTNPMIDAGVLARLRPGTILVNTARPAVVDPGALHLCMAEGRVSLAVFDGFYGPDCASANRLLADFGHRLLVTGHIASHTREAMDRMVCQAVASIENVLEHGADKHAVGNRAGRVPGVPRNNS